ncbi:hypothetical protein JKP88DRAFT_191066 [Tribonema minus]|uniref:Uncharacterized protein n=1 Tax=Tribonema minus TaxID=303371 RepID=A0A835ZHQ4_9STRA|nr:hypothetical protein JKP88DRAFT_191066 [Tribonema minus]
MDRASAGGHIEVMQWLHHEQSLPFTPPTMPTAAIFGRLAALQWLHQVGCPYDIAYICERSLKEGDMISWLRREGATWPQLSDVADAVGADLDAAAVLWAAQQGCPWGDWTLDYCEDVSLGRYSIKKALHDAGCPCQCE